MIVTATEFKVNFGKYLALIEKEDVFITKNGKTIAKVSNPNVSAVESLSGLLEGKIPNDLRKEDLRAERILKYEADN